MESFFIGDVIRKRRKELKLSQEKLAEGICDHVTISRLENGVQAPSHRIVTRLMERLDLPSDKYIAYLSQDELALEYLYKEINSLTYLYEKASASEKADLRESCLALIDKLQTLSGNDICARQLIARTELFLNTSTKPFSPSEERRQLTEILRMTNPNFSIHNLSVGLYTECDIVTINQIAVTYVNEKDLITATLIWKQLYEYAKIHFKHRARSCHLNLIIHNLCQVLIGIGSYQEANQLAKEGYDFCLKYGCYQSLPGILGAMAESSHFLGNDEDSKEIYIQTYYLCKTLKQTSTLSAVCSDAKKYLNLTF